ncbi:MAG: gliding motility-associated C-terminal domain-containing protein [Flavobacteriales bacterium]|nr:gliding motility-associated C-terminal domain-containing protein [Flavobacteriales bacterium]MCC6938850.1 gliding motility-associated C-terminal domain-containing protein [Flavobacteriales bacterium]
MHRSLGIVAVSVAGLSGAWTACAQSRFIENKGQWPQNVTYQAEAGGATFWFERGAMVVDLFDADALVRAHGDIREAPVTSLRHHAVRLRFVNASTTTTSIADEEASGRYNYFIGNDPAKWGSNARAFGRLVMKDVAPGCDAIFHRGRAGLKYDLVVSSGSDPNSLGIVYDGADDVTVRNGALIVSTSLGRITERIPLAYQMVNGEQQVVECTYVKKEGIVGFHLGKFDPTLPLVIDPTLDFATYSGSFSNNFGYTATFDRAGFLYAGSTAFGNQFPITLGAYQTTWAGGAGQSNGGTDIAITKYDTTGSFLVWSTYLGGNGDEMPHSMIVDDNDQLIVLGTTGSTTFPTTPGAFDGSFTGGTATAPAGLGLSYPNGSDMIVARLSADGSALIGSTYLGGGLNDGLNAAPALKFNYADEVRGEVLLDEAGRVWVVSCTQSGNMPITSDAMQSTFGGGSHDGYIARFNPNLSQLQYGSYLGGNGADAVFSGEFDPAGRLFVCGGTTSTNLNVSAGAVQGSYNGGLADAFVARLSGSGTVLEALTYWGSANYDQAYFVELDEEGDVYLFGQTNAPSGQMILNAPYNIPAGGQFITKLDPDLATVLLSSRVGSGDGTPDISPTAFLVDVCDKIYTSGWGSNTLGLGGALTTAGLPVTADAHQSTTDGNDLYLAVFDINMQALTYATYYGGNLSPEHVDGGTSRFDRRGRVYQSVCAGCQNHDDFPTTPGAWSATNNSTGCNNGVLKFDFDAPLVIASFLAPDTICAPYAVQFTNLSNGATGYLWNFGDTQTSPATSPSHVYAQPGTYTVTLTATDPNSCNGQDIATGQVTIAAAAPMIQAMNDTLICGPIASLTLIANGSGSVGSWQWSSNAQFTNTLNATPQDSIAIISPAVSGTYYVQASSGSVCTSRDSVHVIISLGAIALNGQTSICAEDTALLILSGADQGSTIVWDPATEILTGQGTSIVTVAPVEQTTYGVAVTAPSGCSWSSTIAVSVSPLFGSTVGASVDQTTVIAGTVVQLSATPTNGVTYSWAPPSAVSDPTSGNPTATINQTTTFFVTVSDGICTRVDSVKVTVHDLVCDEPDIFVPNTFTPNGDGVNDTLFVRGRFIERLDFQVFDRWGERVFRTEDLLKGWDGRYQGKPADPAVFVYHLTVWCVDGQRYFKKGNVTVVR